MTQAVAPRNCGQRPIGAVELVMANTARVPYDMGTFGSMTTPRMAPVLRRAAASARKLLPPGEWASLRFDELQTAAISSDAKPKTPAGESVQKVNGRDFVTGGHKYTSDMQRPGMLYGRDDPARSIWIDHRITFEAALAERMPGVKIVREGNFRGSDRGCGTSAAAQCCESLQKSNGNDRMTTSSSSDTIYDNLKAGAKIERQPGYRRRARRREPHRRANLHRGLYRACSA